MATIPQVNRLDCWPLDTQKARATLAAFLGMDPYFLDGSYPVNYGLPDTIIRPPNLSPTKKYALLTGTPMGDAFVQWAYASGRGPFWLLPSLRQTFLAASVEQKHTYIENVTQLLERQIREKADFKLPDDLGTRMATQNPTLFLTELTLEETGPYYLFYASLASVRQELETTLDEKVWGKLQEVLILAADFPQNRTNFQYFVRRLEDLIFTVREE